MIVVNGQYPGPLIEANWGDWIQVTVVNSRNEGTSRHSQGSQLRLTSFEVHPFTGMVSCRPEPRIWTAPLAYHNVLSHLAAPLHIFSEQNSTVPLGGTDITPPSTLMAWLDLSSCTARRALHTILILGLLWFRIGSTGTMRILSIKSSMRPGPISPPEAANVVCTFFHVTHDCATR